MKKFVIIHLKGKCTIYEVECEKILPLEDPSLMWRLYPGEYEARIIKPDFLFEKQKNGKLLAPVLFSHAFYETLDEAKIKAEIQIRGNFNLKAMKNKIEYTEEDVAKTISKIEIIML